MPDPVLPTPSPSQIRAEFEDIVVRDLLGPAGGPEEEIDQNSVREIATSSACWPRVARCSRPRSSMSSPSAVRAPRRRGRPTSGRPRQRQGGEPSPGGRRPLGGLKEGMSGWHRR